MTVKCVEYVKITESEECCLTNWAAFYLAEIGFRAKFCQTVGSNLFKIWTGVEFAGLTVTNWTRLRCLSHHCSQSRLPAKAYLSQKKIKDCNMI